MRIGFVGCVTSPENVGGHFMKGHFVPLMMLPLFCLKLVGTALFGD